jgi:cyclophilin family peptidyl-prolyl cis-trans isomerase/HEAT repeat protein
VRTPLHTETDAPRSSGPFGRAATRARCGAARRALAALTVLTLFSGVACGGKAPPKAPPTLAPWDTTQSWILQLEDQRVLRAPSPPPAAQAAAAPKTRKAQAPAFMPPPPDLFRFAADRDPRVRRRAALAMGRIGLRDGVPTLTALLADQEPEVRQMAAFALGLIGSRDAIEALRAALKDPAPIVDGRAAEALGLIGDEGSAAAIAAMVSAKLRASGVASLNPDDETYPQSPEVEAFRLGVYALTRLKAWPSLSLAVLDNAGRPLVRWWPVAYAVQRSGNPGSVPALMAFLQGEGRIGQAFAAKGLGALKEASAVDLLAARADAWRAEPRIAVASIRALGQIGGVRAAPVLRKLLLTRELQPNVRLEVITALGGTGDLASVDALMDLLVDRWPPIRAAAQRALHGIDPNAFTMALSGLEPDQEWSVRAALAPLLARLDPGVASPRLLGMLRDPDKRVRPAVLGALASAKVPNLDGILMQALKDDDVITRAAAAAAIGEAKLPGAEGALVEAYRAAARDAGYQARAAALTALSAYGAARAVPVLKEALSDKDWAVRVQAATLLRRLDPALDTAPLMRPAPGRAPAAYADSTLVEPTVSPHVFIDTDKGTIEIELLVIDAPLTARNFLDLAKQGFFTGLAVHRVVPDFVVQDGDNRGDGTGGPGYTIRDEINQVPYLRGTVGMALEWADTGGSQFFITLSPQPHLDARYTAFGRVVSGLEVADQMQKGDVIRQVRVWDGHDLVVR